MDVDLQAGQRIPVEPLEAAPGIKYKANLGTAYGAGLRVSEVASLKVDNIDSLPMLIRVERGIQSFN
jgi:site-specific recombinase XerD